MPENVSALPSAMQARRQQLEAPTPTEGVPVTNAPTDTPAVSPAPAPAPSDGKVTISRDEFNELQAAAGKARAAEGRADALRLDLEALTQRLTELEAASKGSPNPEAPTQADTWQPTAVQYTDKENEDYGESKPFVEKVVKEVLNTELAKLYSRVNSLEEKILGVKTIAEGASKSINTVKAKSYTDQVKDRVPEFDECVNHRNWHDFTESTDSDTGFTYAELIESNFRRENIEGMVRVFNKFKDKYGVGKAPQPSGYEGSIPSGSGTDTEIDTAPKMLPFSERKEAHKKYINKEITFDEYEVIRKKFEEADREGRVDYNK